MFGGVLLRNNFLRSCWGNESVEKRRRRGWGGKFIIYRRLLWEIITVLHFLLSHRVLKLSLLERLFSPTAWNNMKPLQPSDQCVLGPHVLVGTWWWTPSDCNTIQTTPPSRAPSIHTHISSHTRLDSSHPTPDRQLDVVLLMILIVSVVLKGQFTNLYFHLT